MNAKEFHKIAQRFLSEKNHFLLTACHNGEAIGFEFSKFIADETLMSVKGVIRDVDGIGLDSMIESLREGFLTAAREHGASWRVIVGGNDAGFEANCETFETKDFNMSKSEIEKWTRNLLEAAKSGVPSDEFYQDMEKNIGVANASILLGIINGGIEKILDIKFGKK